MVGPLLVAMTDLVVGSFCGSHILGRCILNVAFPLSAVSDDAIGPAEQLVLRLDHAIVESGGVSIVMAREDSCVNGSLIPVSFGPTSNIWREIREKIERALYEEPIDLIHFHGVDFYHYFPKTEIPTLITLHLPPSHYPRQIFSAPRYKNAFLHCVSVSQHRECPDCEALLSPINGEIGEYLRRYEIIIRGCNANAGMLTYQV